MRNYGFAGTLASLLLLTLGCGANSKREPVYPISGVILYQGKPVIAADVTFFCSEKNRSSFGRTNDQGQFKLTTFAPNDGAVAGSHVIVVTKFQTVAPTTLPDDSDPAYEPPAFNQSTDPTTPKNLLPAKYSDAKTTDLVVSVSAEADNSELSIELE